MLKPKKLGGFKKPKLFTVIRRQDESGVSGEGRVLDGVVFSSGKTVVSWLSEYSSLAVYESFEDFKKIHIDPHPTNEAEIVWLETSPGSTLTKHLNISVEGKVQGVFFRNSARKKAQELGITGFARNELAGTVYIEAEGEEAALNKFTEWLKEGPSSAEVDKIHAESGQIKNYKDFSIGR